MSELVQSSVALPPGTLLGHCEIRSVLGKGGGGISYLAYDAHLEREVVIKEHFPPSLCLRKPGEAEVWPVAADGYERSLSAFCREARILAGLNHPGVVKVYDIFQACGTAYLVMEYVEGERLSDWLPAHATDVPVVTDVLIHLLDALEYLHLHEVLHRDIKPSNIIMQGINRPVLIDFGAAMLGTPPTTITLVGTPGYAAPEQFQPHGRVGPWSDLYALAHSFSKHLPSGVLRRYPRRFVRMLQKAGTDSWDARPASAAIWRKGLQRKSMAGIFVLGLFFFFGVLSVMVWQWLAGTYTPGGAAVPAAKSRGDVRITGSGIKEKLNHIVNHAEDMSAPELKSHLQELKKEYAERIRALPQHGVPSIPEAGGPVERDRGAQ